MRKPLYLIALLLFTLFSFSCKKNSSSERLIKEIIINPLEGKEGLLTDLVDTIFYIPLKTNDSVLIGSIDKIEFYKDRIYVLDKRIARSFFIFDENGNLVQEYNRKGKGPAEFERLSTVSINPFLNQILLFDRGNKKIITLDSNGKFLSESKFSWWVTEADFIDRDHFIAKLGPSSDPAAPYKISILSKEGQNVYKYFPYDNKIGETDFDLTEVFTSTFNKLYVGQLFNDTIYEFNRDRIMPSFVVRYKNFGLPSEDGIINYELKENVFRNNAKYAFTHQIYLENSNSILLLYRYLNDFNLCIYSKKKNSTEVFSKIVNDYDGGVFKFPVQSNLEGCVVSIVYPHELLDSQGSHPKGNLLQIKSKLSATDNPILMIMKIKI